jgi:glyoxylase-like metal-dependent hydrolase (beta-lactamase superfamily II)
MLKRQKHGTNLVLPHPFAIARASEAVSMRRTSHSLSRVLALSLGTLASALAAQAQTPSKKPVPMVKTQPPAFYRMMIGDVEVTALLDENSPWPEMLDELFPKLTAQEKADLSQRTGMQPDHAFSTIAFLVHTGNRLILIDTGGKGGSPTYGQLFPNLKAAGYLPEQVDDIYITHMHPDHVGGLSDGDNRLFPNATVHADQRELPQWQKAAEKGSAAGKTIVAKVAPYVKANRFQPFNGDTTFFEGFRAIASYGHTEGHAFYAIESKGQKLVLWGDFVVNDKVQLEHVDVLPPGEADPAKGIALRKKVFAEAAKDGYVVGGAHFAFPGLGRLRKLEQGYVWVPVDYAAIPVTAPQKP